LAKDISHLIERIEAAEDRLKIRLDALFVSLYEPNYYNTDKPIVNVKGEIHAIENSCLDESLQVVAAVYDSNRRLIGSDVAYFICDKFFGIDIFDFDVKVDSGGDIASVRVFPKQW